MTNILVSDNSPLAYEEFSTPTESQESNILQSIFPSIPRLRDIFEFIELNYHQSIKLKEVAQAVGYSSAYLTDLVRRLTGKTVNNWIVERRIAEARRLLLETDNSIEKIAFKIGYQNLNHFYSQFRNYHHNTPHAWRKRQQQDCPKKPLKNNPFTTYRDSNTGRLIVVKPESQSVTKKQA
ncbi:AraC family transcriptional regulator [Lyngbya sp. PCC 8106]|uniref:helix-turn-helix domain-containing protein n=1 Tax=Lyngbya sp. (strain PCC 8106) TaxID=313612 RepID=UPI0000EADA82|nr:AraC family transcriptional regulator [Lyngbya sp. PCC 8106]EAW36441.1 Transcriptional Regulator, AraC family protein [Lyngbya sp. PCC 8106]